MIGGSSSTGGRRGLSSTSSTPGPLDPMKEAKRTRMAVEIPAEHLRMPLREEAVQALFEVLKSLASSIDGYAIIPSVPFLLF